MRFPVLIGMLLLHPALGTSTAFATDFEATLDRNEIIATMGPPTVIQVTLRNKSTNAIFVTGVKVILTEGARGEVHNPALLHERLLRLEPGQSWGGPLVVIKPSHRGPLWVSGTIQLIGGNQLESADTLASIPLRVIINDPRRNVDGSYNRGTKPVCDRSADACCDVSETSCFQREDRCIYVAEGYGRQNVCVNRQAEKTYARITDLRVSSDGVHMAYLASFHCHSDGREERCERVIVIDHVEIPGLGMATQLDLSPDGLHYAYIRRDTCALFSGEERCTGAKRPIVDGSPVKTLPTWYINQTRQ